MAMLPESPLAKILKRNLQELHQKVSMQMQMNEQLTTEDHYQLSQLHTYLELESWEAETAILLLCGIEPQGAIIASGYRNARGAWIDKEVINHAIFFGEKDTYDIPTMREIRERKNELQKDLDNLPGLIKDEKCFWSDTSASNILEYEQQIVSAEQWLKTFDDWVIEEHWIEVWGTRKKYGECLDRIKKLWNSGKHQSVNPIRYYIDWALEKGIEITWLEWAISKELLSTENTNLVNSKMDERHSESTTGDSDLESTDKEFREAFDPLPIEGIAEMFPLTSLGVGNLQAWKRLAGNASRNKLNKTRVVTSSGKAKSTFDPWLVGEWIISENRGLTQEAVYRKLAKNLPMRSAHLKDFLLP